MGVQLPEKIKNFGLSEKMLDILVKQGALSRWAGPGRGRPTKKDLEFLRRLAIVWKNTAFVKETLRQVRSKVRREKLVREFDLAKPEQWTLNRYLNTKGKLYKRTVTAELVKNFGLPEKKAGVIVEKMRARAYTRKHRRKAGERGTEGRNHGGGGRTRP